MTTKHSNDPRSILDRIKTIVPGPSDAFEAVQREHDVSRRLLGLIVLNHASLVEFFEIISQAILNSTDLTMAQETLISDQKINMRALEKLADQTASAQTVIHNLDVWLRSDPGTIQHFLEIMDLNRLTEAAGKLPRERLVDLIKALQDAAR